MDQNLQQKGSNLNDAKQKQEGQIDLNLQPSDLMELNDAKGQQEGQVDLNLRLSNRWLQGGKMDLRLQQNDFVLWDLMEQQQKDFSKIKAARYMPSTSEISGKSAVTSNREAQTSEDSVHEAHRKRPKTVFNSADSWRPSLNLQENIMEEGEVLDECVESSAKAFHLTSAEHFKMPSYEHLEFFDNPVMPDAAHCWVEPRENHDGIQQLLLTLENTRLGESIFVGAVVHAIPSGNLEFYFFNAKDMAICVGVGLPRAKVILHNDLSITIEETTVSERELRDTWMPFFSDDSCHLVMKVQMGAPDTQVNGEQTENGETLSRYGVGFDFGSLYVNETYDATEVSWPLLYDMALFILKTNALQCHDQTREDSSAQGSRSFQGNNQDNNMVQKLYEKRDNVFNGGNLQGGGGDGDEDGFGGNHSVSKDDEDLPVVLKVTVHPLPNCDILDELELDGLIGASISPKLVFEFHQNDDNNRTRISIKTETHLELDSERDVKNSTNLFGWYHNDIEISFGCQDIEGHKQSALLENNRISNPKTSYKSTVVKSIISTKATTNTASGQADFKVFGSGLQGSLSDSRKKQEAISAGDNIEMQREGVLDGFSFQNSSRKAPPARVKFCLFYPLRNLSIWDNKEYLQSQGIFSSIEPHIEGTWNPIDKCDTSPYFFKVERLLTLHDRAAGLDHVHKQNYNLPFYVNHSMTHFKHQTIELHGNQKSVRNVLMIGSVNSLSY